MSGGGKQTVGYKYYMGLHFGLSHGPVNEVVEARVGGRTAWLGSRTASGTIAVNAPDLFGGDDREGGIVGNLDIMMGESTQSANLYLTVSQGTYQPAYRGLLTAVFRGSQTNSVIAALLAIIGGSLGAMSGLVQRYGGQICSNNPYPKPWAFRLRRSSAGWDNDAPWYAAKSMISIASGSIKAMNPAHIIYETLTNRDWGMGYPAGSLNDAVFRTAADKLYDEGFGLCLLWTRQDSIEAFLQQVINYIGASVATNRATGLFELTLIRDDYDVSTIPAFTQANLVELVSLEEGTINGAVNELVVKYHDPVTHHDSSATVHALGNIQAQGVVISDSRDYHGIPEFSLAVRAAQRDLRASSVPLKRLEIKLDRTAWMLKPGDVFKLTLPSHGLSNLVCRVGEVDYGLLASSAITVRAAQDVFALPDTVYTAVQPTGWLPPDPTPTTPAYRRVMEATYRDTSRQLSAGDFAALSSTAGFIVALADSPSGLALNYELWTRTGANAFTDVTNGDWTPTATIQASLQPYDTVISLLSGSGLDQVGIGAAALIDDGTASEIVRIDAIDPVAGTATIARGCIDTTPQPHPAGARIWFYDLLHGADPTEWVGGETIDTKILTHTSQGVLDISVAPVDSVTLIDRIALPYPPQRLTVNAVRSDLQTEITGPLVLGWYRRNKITQTDQLIDATVGDIPQEAGTTYTVTLRDGGGTLIGAFTGITGAGWTWPTPDDTHSAIAIAVNAVNAVGNSFESLSVAAIQRYGWGLRWGNDWGGG